MTDVRPLRRRRIWRLLLVAAMVMAVMLGGLAWYATTNSFQAMVRRRLVAELERITGGRVELGGLHTTPFRLRVDVRDLTIHGLEKPGEVPYAHVDRLVAEVKIISVLGAEFGFRSVVLEHPIVHIISYPDGTTNQPVPRLKQASGTNSVEDLFALSINRLDVRQGELLWNDRKIPLDFSVNDISADMAYSYLHRRYEGNVLLGKGNVRVKDARPMAWTAEAHFSLGKNSLEVKSLKATTGRSHLEAAGHLEDFGQPKIDATYSATVDLAEAANITRRRELRGGSLQASGHGSWSLDTFSSTGKLQVNDVDWTNQSVDLHKASGSTQFSISPQHITLSQIEARLFGGSAAGDADIVNWLDSTPPAKLAREKKAGEQKGTVRLRFKDMSADALAAAISKPNRPLNRIALAGSANGTVAAHWNKSPQNLEADIAFDVAAPGQVRPGQLPLNAHARVTYRAAPGELNVAEFNAATRATQVRASGMLSSNSALKISVTTTDLSEWQPALAAFGNLSRIPLTLHGRALFTGTATGEFPDVSLAGNLQVQDFDVLLPATSHTSERQVHWNSLAADVQVSQHMLSVRNGSLHRGGTAVNFDLSAGLQQGRFTDTSPFHVRLETHNTEVAEILALAGYEYPITGTMNLFFQASGTKAEAHGAGRLQLANGMIYDEPVQQFTADLRLSNRDLEFNNMVLTHDAAMVTGDAAYNLSTHNIRFNLSGKNFDLARVRQLQTRGPGVTGLMDFTASGSGTTDEPVINAAISLRDLAFDQERMGSFTVEAVTHGADLHLTGRSQFEHGDLAFTGDIRVRDDWPSTMDFHFSHLDVDPFLKVYLQGHVTGHSAVAGDLHLQGPLRKPAELALTCTLSELYAEAENIKVHNAGPVRFAVSGQSLKIEQFHLLGDGTDLAVNGSVQLTGEHRLELRAQGSANLKLIETFNPDFTASGVVTVDLAVAGTTSNPVPQGHLQIASGSIAYIDLPSALSDINGSLVLNRDRLQIESFTARTGGGLVTLRGYATSYNHQFSFDLNVTGQDVRLRYPPGVSSTATTELHWAGTSSSSTLSGEITVNKLAVTPGFDFGGYVARAAQSSALPQTNPLLNRIRLDLHLVTTPELQMQTAVVRLSGDADLNIRGTAAKPVVLGRANVIEGDVYFNGTKYHLERGDVAFTSPVKTAPVVDLQASTHVRDYDITLSINGDPTKPNGLHVNYRSEPPLPEADIVALLALGRTQEESAQMQASGQSSLTQEASNAILSEALNATVSNRVQRLFGVSRIKIDPQGLSTETNPARGPQVTIEQQVANNLTVTYSTNVSQASQQIIQVEYNLTRNVSIVGIRDQNGVVSFDVKIRQRKK